MKKSFIAVFDSGVGGISVLKELVKQMPNENFFYYGDSANAPYGTKSASEVCQLSLSVAEKLEAQNIKAIVVACNTATSAAISALRKKYESRENPIAVIGIEPALKPAIKVASGKKIVVLATPMTLSEEKFNLLLNEYKNATEIVCIAAPKLVEFVEAGNLDGVEVESYLREIFTPAVCENLKAVVLGCTHFPFVKNAIAKVVGEDVVLLDGGEGTARETKRRLSEQGLLSTEKSENNIVIENSLDGSEMVALSWRLLAL